MAGTHSLLSPSKADMWSECLAALAACQGLPPEGASEYAAEGTAYHTIAERAIRERASAVSYVGEVVEADGFKFTIEQESAEALEDHYCTPVRQELGEVLLEQKLDASELLGIPGQGGTGDAVILWDYGYTISVRDLKMGRGVQVFAMRNPEPGVPRWKLGNRQLLLYLASAMHKYSMVGEWRRGKIYIHQPRLNGGPWYDEAEFTADEINEFVAFIRERAQKAYELYQRQVAGTLPREELIANMTPGIKQCTWCPLRGECPKRTQQVMDQFPVVQDQEAVSFMSDDDVAAAMAKVGEIERWVRDIRSEAFRRAMMGRRIKGFRLAEGKQGNRAWRDEKQATAYITTYLEGNEGDPELAFEKSPISPTEAERRFKKEWPELWSSLNGCPDKKTKEPLVESFIHRAPGSKTLVPDYDQAPHIEQPSCEFAVMPNVEDLL